MTLNRDDLTQMDDRFVKNTTYLQDVLGMKKDISALKNDMDDVKETLSRIEQKLFQSNGNKSMVEVQREHNERISRVEEAITELAKQNKSLYNKAWTILTKITVGIIVLFFSYILGMETGVLDLILKVVRGH